MANQYKQQQTDKIGDTNWQDQKIQYSTPNHYSNRQKSKKWSCKIITQINKPKHPKNVKKIKNVCKKTQKQKKRQPKKKDHICVLCTKKK